MKTLHSIQPQGTPLDFLRLRYPGLRDWQIDPRNNYIQYREPGNDRWLTFIPITDIELNKATKRWNDAGQPKQNLYNYY